MNGLLRITRPFTCARRVSLNKFVAGPNNLFLKLGLDFKSLIYEHLAARR